MSSGSICKPDTHLPDLANLMGKGFILPAPVLPHERFRNLVLPTPMATTQAELPVALKIYDASGREATTRFLGRLPRNHRSAVDVAELLNGSAHEALPSGYGHMELLYDFRDGGDGDGWLHALFRYEDRKSGHAAETSFGAHIFNTVITYGNEPQSYSGAPPGPDDAAVPAARRRRARYALPPDLSGLDAVARELRHDADAAPPRRRRDREGQGPDSRAAGRCCGARRRRSGATRSRAPATAASSSSATPTCRLFGYHGLVAGEDAFSLDHMFGF